MPKAYKAKKAASTRAGKKSSTPIHKMPGEESMMGTKHTRKDKKRMDKMMAAGRKRSR